MLSLKRLLVNILTIRGFEVGKNVSIIEGNNNIIIQDIKNTDIRITQSINNIDEETFIVKIIAKIIEAYPNINTKVPRILNTVLFAAPKKTIGRIGEVMEILDCLNTDNSLLLVSGVGGIGKTVLANYYHSLAGDLYSHVIWVNGNQDLEEALLFDIKLLKNLGIAKKLMPILPTLSDSKNALQREYAIAEIESALKNLPAKTLVVIDNADSDNFKTIQKWQSTFEDFHFLITSRETNSNLNIYELGVLSLEDALELFYNFYKYEKNDSIIESIFEKIHYHTLLIELIAKAGEEGALPLEILHNFLETGYIEHEGLQVSIDINELKESGRLPEEERIVNYIELLFRTILKLDEDEKNILSSLSIIPTTPHSKELLLKILKELKKKDSKSFNSVEVLNLLNSLHRKGYLGRSKGIYSLHSLVASATRKHVEIQLAPKKQLIINIKNLLYFHPDEGNPVEKFSFLPFGDTILKYLPLPSNEVDVKPYTSLQNELGRVYRIFSDYNRAANLMEGGIRLLRQYDDKGIETKKALTDRLTNLAMVYSGSGDYLKAKDLLEEVIDKDLNNIKIVHPGKVSNLASIYKNLGEYSKAIDLLTFSLNQSKWLLGENDLTTAHSMFHLGMCYKESGNYSKALDLTTKALSSFEKKLNPQHYRVIDALLGVSTVYAELGNFERCNQILENVLKESIELFGEHHPNIYNIKNSLAINYGDFGKYEKAIELLEEVILYLSKHLGENHPNVIGSESNLSIYYEKMGEYEKAIEIAEKSVEKSISFLGINNPIVAARIHNLAVVYTQLGRNQDAIIMFKKAVEITTNNFGQNNIKIAPILNGLGSTYGQIGDLKNALDYLTKALAIQMALLNKNHPDIGSTQSNLSDVCFALNDFSKCKELIEASLKNGFDNFGKKHPVIPKRMSKLGSVYFQLGDKQKGIDIMDEAILIQKELIGNNHPEVAQMYVVKGSMLGGRGDFEGAEYYFRLAYSILSSQLGENSFHTQNVMKIFNQLQNIKRQHGKN